MPTFVEREGTILSKTTVKDGLVVEERVEDVQPILDANREYHNHHDGYSKSRDLQHVATIPAIIVEKWLREGFDVFKCDPKDLERRLNDGGWTKLRTGGGRV
jgi:hypothetical protein